MIRNRRLTVLALSALGATLATQPGRASEPAPPGCRAVVLEIGSPTSDPERQTLGYLCDRTAGAGDVALTGALPASGAGWMTPETDPERGTFGFYAGAGRR